MPLLVVEKGYDKGKAVPLPPQGTVLLGRDSSTALPLHDTMASRMHCKIEEREDGFWLTDLESMNGTVLNGSKVRESVKLSFGDLIKVGDTLFTFTSEESSATTLSGQRMGGYRIIERLGRGGMGTVYKAEQIDLQRLVALKVISEEHTKDKDFVDLFVHEARAAAKLNHPNIVQVYDVKRHGNLHYFSMEYVSGGSVQDVLNKQRKVPVDQAAQWIADAARGLDYAHKKGIVHRDVKPDNLMISETGTVKIGDMGLARGLNEKIGPEEETSVIGTPHYIAPEQVLGRPADFRCDIYSLGATGYRMLTGVTPFQAPSVRDLVNKKVREDAPAAHELNPEVPKAVSEVLARMMARDPDRRTQTMAEVAAALERFQRGQSDAADRQASTPIEVLVGNRKLLMGAVALLAIVVVGGVMGALLLKDPAKTNGPGPVRTVDPEEARQALTVVELRELKQMDKSDARSIEKVLAEYSLIAEKYAGTDSARKAGELGANLERQLRLVRADDQLRKLEADDAMNWQKASEALAARRAELDPVEATIRAYADFSKSEEARRTPAGEKAAARAAAIQKWKARLEACKADYDRALLKAQPSRDQKRYRDAWMILKGFQEETEKAEQDLSCDFARDRYLSLFFDEAAGQEAEAVVSEARTQWARVEEQARALARDKNYEGAIKLVDQVISESVAEVAGPARGVKAAYEAEADDLRRREIEAAEGATRAALARARAAYAQGSQEVRSLVLKFDFKAALQKMKSIRDANTADELKERLDRRVSELERVENFKVNLIGVINARDESGSNPFRFKREYKDQTLEGTIARATDREFTVSLPLGGGTFDKPWAKYDGESFYEFVKSQWKYTRDQESYPKYQCDLAAILMEFGLYGEALREIEAVLAAMKAVSYPAGEPSRLFAEEYRDRIEKGESAEYSEIESQKRVDRLEALMKTLEYAAARKEIDVLRSRYAKTQAYQQAVQRIAEHAQRIEKEGGEQLTKTRREERWQLLLGRVADETAAARKAQPDIVQRLGRWDDPFGRAVHLGSVYAASGELSKSTEKYLEAKRTGEQMLVRREVGREFLPYLAHVYGEIFRNAVQAHDRKAAQAIRNEGNARFVNPATNMEEPWWPPLRDWLQKWGDDVFPVEERRIPRLRDEIHQNPDDAQKIWALAQSLSEGTGNLGEARGHYAWLLENHPEFPQVANGNVLHRLAEIHFAAREVASAIKRYREFLDLHKEHPKAADPGADGAKRRLDDSYKLQAKMGYPRDKGK